MWALQIFASSTHFVDRGVPCVCSPVGVQSSTLLYLLDQCPGGGAPLYACYGAFLFLLNLAPGGVAGACRSSRELDGTPTNCPHLGETNNGTHWFLLSWAVSSAPRELSWYPNLLYVVPFSRCVVGSQLSLKRNCSKHRCTLGELSVHLHHHLGSVSPT